MCLCSYVKESLKPGLVKQASEKLKQVDKFLGAHQWFAGDRVSSLELTQLHTSDCM